MPINLLFNLNTRQNRQAFWAPITNNTHPSPWNFPLSYEVTGTVPSTSHRRTAKSLSHRTYCVSVSHHQLHGCCLWRPPHVQRVRTIRSCPLESSLNRGSTINTFLYLCYDMGIKWHLHVCKASENFTSKLAQFRFTKQIYVSRRFTFIHSKSFYASLIHIRIPQTPVSLRRLFKQSLFTVRIIKTILRFA